VLDARLIPPAVRPGAVLGAFDSLVPGSSMVLIAPHAPVPLLAQMADRAPVEVKYLLDAPNICQVEITRC